MINIKHYIINQPKEFGVYFREDELVVYVQIKDTLTNALATPGAVTITVTNPCDTEIVSDVAMTSTVTGYYSYDLSTTSSSCFGIYDVAISTVTEASMSHLYFVILPWDILGRARQLSGTLQQSDMTDYKLSMIAWNAYQEALEEVYELHYKERPLCNDDGEWFDGVNEDFKLKSYPFADRNGDGSILGDGETNSCCPKDLTFRYYDCDVKQEVSGHVAVDSSDSGRIHLRTSGDLPVTSNIKRPQVTYWTRSETFDLEMFKEAVAYLTAHKALIALQALNKATVADLQTNRDLNNKRFLEKYNDIIEQIGFPMIGSGR